MVKEFEGLVKILDSARNLTIGLDGRYAGIVAGGNGQDGDLILKNSAGNQRVWIDGQTADILIKNSAGDSILHVVGDEGDIIIYRKIDGSNRQALRFDASAAALYIGSQGNSGDIFVRNGNGINDTTFRVRGKYGDILVHRKIDGVQRTVMEFAAVPATLKIGCQGKAGDIKLRDKYGIDRVHLNGYYGNLGLKDKYGIDRVHLNGQYGHLTLKNGMGMKMINLNGITGNISAGIDNAGNPRVLIDGQRGDIQLSGADCAEEFNVLDSSQIDPGTVMILCQKDTLMECRKAYDKRVVGVVSGAGDYTPGIILGKKQSYENGIPIALTGKVYCKVDSNYSPVEVGDLLTTSPNPGHAMKAMDPLKSFGAVIGKALEAIDEGIDLIPILVGLQ